MTHQIEQCSTCSVDLEESQIGLCDDCQRPQKNRKTLSCTLKPWPKNRGQVSRRGAVFAPEK